MVHRLCQKYTGWRGFVKSGSIACISDFLIRSLNPMTLRESLKCGVRHRREHASRCVTGGIKCSCETMGSEIRV